MVRVSIWGNEKVLEINNGDGCILMSVNCTLKNGYNGKCYMYFTTKKKALWNYVHYELICKQKEHSVVYSHFQKGLCCYASVRGVNSIRLFMFKVMYEFLPVSFLCAIEQCDTQTRDIGVSS